MTTLCGKEVPLKTNWEMVQTLMKLNGTSSVGAFSNTKYESDYYWKFKHVLTDGKGGRWAKLTNQSLGPVPYNLTVMKSLAYYSLSVSFVDFLLNDEIAIVFRKFMDHTHIPEEHFVSTLFCMKGKGRLDYLLSMPFQTRSFFYSLARIFGKGYSL